MEILLRQLEEKDAEYMLEWMHNSKIAECFRVDFANYTQRDVLKFIENSFDEKNQHFAIVDQMDEYLGTVSLKNISYVDNNAEYAIVLRECVQGRDVAGYATKKLLKYAFEDLKLKKVYLNVLENNGRAKRFYEKCGFVMEGTAKNHVYIKGKYYNLEWYAISK